MLIDGKMGGGGGGGGGGRWFVTINLKFSESSVSLETCTLLGVAASWLESQDYILF